MKVISSREFRDNQKIYFDLAPSERIIIKRENEFLEIVPRGNTIPENPSPSDDPYFDNPKNLEATDRGIKDIQAGRTTEMDMNELQKFLELSDEDIQD